MYTDDYSMSSMHQMLVMHHMYTNLFVIALAPRIRTSNYQELHRDDCKANVLLSPYGMHAWHVYGTRIGYTHADRAKRLVWRVSRTMVYHLHLTSALLRDSTETNSPA